MAHLLQLMNNIDSSNINWSPCITHISSYLMSFSYCRSHLWYHITFSHHTLSLGSFWVWQFLRLSLFFMTLTVLKIIDKVACKTFLSLVFSNVFSWFQRGYGFWGWVPQRWHVLLITLYLVYMISSWFTSDNINLYHWF